MKFKTTKKNIRDNYNRIIKIGYCNAQYLLKYENEIAYSTRTEGWACDYYDIDGVLISTGYAPLEAKNTHSTYDIVRRYDDQACKIACDYSLDYETQKAQVTALLIQYIQEVTR